MKQKQTTNTMLRVRQSNGSGKWFIQSLDRSADAHPGWNLFKKETYQSRSMAEDIVNWHVDNFPETYEMEE